MGQIPLLVSTDALESIFGKFKTVLQRSPKADFSRTVLIIPALFGRLDADAVDSSLRNVTHKDLRQWQETNFAETQVQKRRAFQARMRVPTARLRQEQQHHNLARHERHHLLGRNHDGALPALGGHTFWTRMQLKGIQNLERPFP